MAEQPAFSIYSTFIPKSAGGTDGRNVLTGYLIANSDAGNDPAALNPDYGKLTLLTLPSQTIPGPGQVQNQFSSDPEVANQLALLERGETEVLRGNVANVDTDKLWLQMQYIY